jgi:thiosulfate/3-mercaptopyruvate sulfurtransferase
MFMGIPNLSMLVSTEELESLIREERYTLIDARARPRYLGEAEPIDPIAGHIPRSKNRFHQLNLDPSGFMLPKEELRSDFSQLIGQNPPERTIVYCGSGVTSCHHLLAMQIAGLNGGRLYLGSWSEWIRDPNHPIALGDESW